MDDKSNKDVSYINLEGVFDSEDVMNVIDGVQVFDTTLYMNECWRRLNASNLLHKFLAVLRYAGKNNLTLDDAVKQIFKTFPGMFKQEEFNTYILIDLMHDYPIVAEAYGYDINIGKELELDALQHHALDIALKSEVIQDAIDYKTNWIDQIESTNISAPKPRFNFNLGGK